LAKVRLARRAVKDLDSLQVKAARKILDELSLLGSDPQSLALDVKPLTGRRPWRRLRVGAYRILFRPAEGGRVLLVARVIDRKELERAVETLAE
jgi:mRNA-degrading endonuclease RelE of RelBE toxin-antitoxin system